MLKRTSLNGMSHECNQSLGVLLRLRDVDPVHVGSSSLFTSLSPKLLEVRYYLTTVYDTLKKLVRSPGVAE